MASLIMPSIWCYSHLIEDVFRSPVASSPTSFSIKAYSCNSKLRRIEGESEDCFGGLGGKIHSTCGIILNCRMSELAVLEMNHLKEKLISNIVPIIVK